MKLSYKESLSGILHLASGNIASQLLSILAIPIIVRIYDPSNIAFLGGMIFVITLSSGLSTLKVESMVLGRSKVYFSDGLILAKNFLPTTSLICLPIMIIYIHFNNLLFSLFESIFIAIIVYFSVITLSYGIIARSLYIKIDKTKMVAKAQFLRVAIGSISRIVLFKLDAFGVILGELFGIYIFQRKLKYKLVKKNAFYNLKISLASLNIYRKKYPKFAIYENLSSCVGNFNLGLPFIFCGSLYGMASAGHFWILLKLASLLNTQLGTVVADVFMRGIADIRTESTKFLYSIILKMLIILLGFAFGLSVTAYFSAELIVTIFTGSNSEDLATIFLLLVVWKCTSFVALPVLRLSSVYDKQKMKLILDIIFFLGMVAIYIYSKTTGIEITQFVAIISVFGIAHSIINILLHINLVRSSPQ